jgi:hypothetical protein
MRSPDFITHLLPNVTNATTVQVWDTSISYASSTGRVEQKRVQRKDALSKGRIMQWKELPRLFFLGHIGRGRNNSARDALCKRRNIRDFSFWDISVGDASSCHPFFHDHDPPFLFWASCAPVVVGDEGGGGGFSANKLYRFG